MGIPSFLIRECHGFRLRLVDSTPLCAKDEWAFAEQPAQGREVFLAVNSRLRPIEFPADCGLPGVARSC